MVKSPKLPKSREGAVMIISLMHQAMQSYLAEIMRLGGADAARAAQAAAAKLVSSLTVEPSMPEEEREAVKLVAVWMVEKSTTIVDGEPPSQVSH